MADTVSYSSVEGVFRASFDKSTARTWSQECWTPGRWGGDSFFLFAIMVQILEHPYIKFHWKLKTKEVLSWLKMIFFDFFSNII